MARRPFIAGNWKMHKTGPEAAETAEQLADLVGVVVGVLLTHDDQVGLFVFDNLHEHPSDRVGVELVGFHQDAAVGAHGEALADLLDRVGGADAADDDLPAVDLIEAKRLFDGDFVEGVRDEVHPLGHERRAVGGDLHFPLVVGDALDGDENFHGFLLIRWSLRVAKSR